MGTKQKAKRESRKLPPWASTPEVADFLRMTGWFPSPEGWRHKNLRYAWPATDARDLQAEAESGRQDLVHRILRGE